MTNRREQVEAVTDFIFLGSKITADGDCSHESKRHLLLERKAMTNLDSMLKSRDHFANKGPSIQSYGFSGSHVWMWELDHKKSWVLKNWCFQFVVLEKTLESPLSSKEIKPDNPKGNQPWIFIRGTDVEAEAPILWPVDAKSQLTGKDPDAGKDWGQAEKRATEDEMIGWHTNSMDMSLSKLWEMVKDREASCASPWRCKELDRTSWLNNNKHLLWEFPDGPLVRSLCFHCGGHTFHPLLGANIPQALWRGQKRKKMETKAQVVYQKL